MILTSGEDRIFPKDLLIGTVSMANQGNPFQVIHVRPAARLDRLEDVLILLTPQELKKANDSADSSGSESPTPGIVQKETAQAAASPKPVAASSGTGTPSPAPKN
jgi:hypothetical protein